jgi:EAL domain-containing protein (putative c-di-GMP-specific phosphodiesterase class I)
VTLSLNAVGRTCVLTEEVRESALSWRVGVEYQPIVDVHTGETVAHEALARFQAEDGSPLPPVRVFHELRRDLDLLADVELELKRLQIERAPGKTVFVNVDADGWAVARSRGDDRLMQLLQASHGVEVVVEVVETVDGRAAKRVRAMMRELREAGVSVALDDVGSSGAMFSLDALRGADLVKFDRSVLDRPGDPRERAIARGLVAVARALGARAVLEGVERPEQLRVAEALGFDLVQGFLLSDRTIVVPAR